MDIGTEGQDIGKLMNIVPVKLVQDVDVSKSIDDSPDGARVMSLIRQ